MKKLIKQVKIGKRGHKRTAFISTETGRFVSKGTAESYFQALEATKRERLKAAAEKAKNIVFQQPSEDEIRPISTKKGIRFIDERGRFVNKVFWPDEYKEQPTTVITYWEGVSYLKDTPEQFVKFIIRDQTGRIIETHTTAKLNAILEMQEFIRNRNSVNGDGHYFIIKIYNDFKNERTVVFDIHDYDTDSFNNDYKEKFQ